MTRYIFTEKYLSEYFCEINGLLNKFYLKSLYLLIVRRFEYLSGDPRNASDRKEYSKSFKK